jgi:hypothetical protein
MMRIARPDPTPFLDQSTVAAQPASVGQPILAEPVASSPFRSPVDWLFMNLANADKGTERRPITGNQVSERLPIHIHNAVWQTESQSRRGIESRFATRESGGTTDEADAIDLAFSEGFELIADDSR